TIVTRYGKAARSSRPSMCGYVGQPFNAPMRRRYATARSPVVHGDSPEPPLDPQRVSIVGPRGFMMSQGLVVSRMYHFARPPDPIHGMSRPPVMSFHT